MLYHVDICLPKHIGELVPKGIISITPTKHAYDIAWARCLTIPSKIDMKTARLVEIEDKPLKFVVRVDNGPNHDIVLVVVNNGPKWMLKTIWENRKSDNHKTLDRRKYYPFI